MLNFYGQSMATSASPQAKPAGGGSSIEGGAFADKFVATGSGQALSGHEGDDSYYVKSEADTVFETYDAGIDTVYSVGLETWSLGANLENLVLSGKATGFGNGLNNIIEGMGNDQTLWGGGGDDVLIGGAGGDAFAFRPGSGYDVIADFSFADGDKIRIRDYDVSNDREAQAAMTQVGDDVILKLSDTDAVRIANVKVTDFSAGDFQFQIDTSKATLTFSDEFDSLDLVNRATGEGRWSTTFDFGQKDGPKSLASHTLLNNGEDQIYVDPTYAGEAPKGAAGLGLNPFTLNDGVLTITAQKVAPAVSETLFDRTYTSGLLTTETSFSQLYGYFEMRAQLPIAHGVWPAFWLLPQDGTNPLEIDIMEQIGGRVVFGTSHFAVEGTKTREVYNTFVPDITEFHTYGLLWSAKEITWYVDGVVEHSMATPADMNRPMFMLANVAVGGKWAGDPDFDSSAMSIDYIRAYSVDPDARSGSVNPDHLEPPPPSAPAIEIVGSEGADSLRGDARSEQLRGLGGDDLIRSGEGGDIIDGGDGSDTASFADSADGVVVRLADLSAQAVNAGRTVTLISIENLVGSNAADLLVGDAAANSLSGAAGDDTLDGGAGADTLLGGAGADVMLGGAGDDAMDGGAGRDTASYGNAVDAVTVSLAVIGPQATGGGGTDTLVDVENLYGSAFDDTLTGSDDKNLLDGGIGDDVLSGGKGKDVLVGGEGADLLSGGSGADTFIIRSAAESNVNHADRIVDFLASDKDIIDLSGIDAESSKAGNQDFHYIGSAAFSGSIGELRVQAEDGGLYVRGDVDGDGAADFSIFVAGTASLTAADFIL